MSARAETWLWLAQRASAMVLAVMVIVHLITMIYAVQGGLSAAEILGRTRDSVAWVLFYGVFVLAAAVHAPIGLRTIVLESTPLEHRIVNPLAAAFSLLLLIAGWRAVAGLFA